ERIEKETFEALKVLAAGVAHDMNNILTALVGNVSLANMLISNLPEASTRLVEAERACFRAKDLAHQLLSFSKGSEPVKKTAQLEEVLRRCTDFYLRESKSIPKLAIADDLW